MSGHSGQGAAAAGAETAPASRAFLIAFGLGLGPAMALGIARFAYALLVPAMRADLAWSYTQAGAMNTTNALGYLAGALVAAPLIQRIGAARAFTASLAGTAIVVLLTGATERFDLLLVLRLIPGVTGGVAFVAGGVLVARLAQSVPGRAGLLMGIYYGGPGIGIALSGASIPPLVDIDPALWRWAWVALGVISLAFFLPAAMAGRALSGKETGRSGDGAARDSVTLAPAMFAHFLFAMGYICYMTFMFAMLRENAASTLELSGFWVLLGAATVASSRVWAGMLQKSADGRALATLLAVVTVASVLPLHSQTSILVIALSGILFGVSFFAVVTSTTALVRKGRPEAQWPRSIAGFTIAFGTGQSIGPLLGGYVGDNFGGLQATIALGAGLVGVACLVALLQPRVDRGAG